MNPPIPPLLCAIGLLCIPALHGGVIFSDQFEYGAGVPGREAIKEGDPVKKAASIPGSKSPWQSPAKNGLVFAPEKGLTPAPESAQSNASLFIDVDPGLFKTGAPVRVQLDVIPGESWSNTSAIRGIWLGFVNMKVPRKDLLPNVNETADHLAVRYAISKNFSESRVDAQSGIQGQYEDITGSPLPSQPRATYRLALVYNPEDHSFEASVTELESGATQTLANILPQAPNFTAVRVDFTAIDRHTGSPLPVIKSLSLEK